MTQRTHFALCLIALALVGADDVPDIVALQAAVDRAPSDPARWFALADALEQAGRESEALKAYARADRLPPAREALGRLRRFIAPVEAAADYESAAQMYGESAAARRCRRRAVECLAAANDKVGAAARLRALLTAPDAELSSELPELFGRCGRPASLLPALKSYVAQAPSSAEAQACLAAAHESNGDLSEALVIAHEVVAEVPSVDCYRVIVRIGAARPSYHHELIRGLAEKTRAAERRLSGESPSEQAVRLNDPAVRQTQAIKRALSYEPAAVAALLPQFVDLRRSEDGLGFVRLAIELTAVTDNLAAMEAVLKPYVDAAVPGTAPAVYVGLLRVYLRQAKYVEAAELASRIVAKPPPNISLVGVNYNRAWAYMHLDREAEALAAADEAVKLATDESALSTRLLRLDVLLWFDRLDQAAAEARQLLAQFPDKDKEVLIRQRWASHAAGRGDVVVAEAHMRRVLELDPGDVGAHNDLGYFLAERGRNLPEAERLCRFAVERGRPAVDLFDAGGDDPAYRDSLGWVLFRRGRLTAARTELERALALPGGRGHSVIWEHYGDVLAATGQTVAARKAWSEALGRAERERRRKNDPRPHYLRQKLAAADR